jgi:uncharacterized membrane protein YbhN (UPF0104 family)
MLVKIIVGIVISAAVIYYSIKAMGGLNPGQILSMKINWWLAALSAVLFAFSNYIRGLSYTFGVDRNISHMMAFRIIGIGHSTNMVLPLHAGEALRFPYFPKSYSMLERTKQVAIQGATDLIVIVLLAIISLPFTGFKEPLLSILRIVSLIIAALIVAAVLLVIFVPALKKYSGAYMTAKAARMFLWALLSWLTILLSMWVAVIALGYAPGRSAGYALATFTATNIANFIPASPGGLGLFEYGVVLGLGGLGVPMAESKLIGVYLHFLQYLAMLPLGAALYFSGFGDRQRGFMSKEEKEDADKTAIVKKD